jgi:hypothetical protein
VAVLGLWLGVVVMAGVVAGVVFPTMQDLGPRMPAYEGFDGPHWMIAAGKTANQCFKIAVFAQLGCGFVVLWTHVILAGWLRKRTPLWCILARQVTLLFVVGCLTYNFVVLRPRMDGNVGAFWRAAAAGKNEEARTYEAAFRADHPVATRVYGMTAVGLVLCVGAVGLSWWKRGERP